MTMEKNLFTTAPTANGKKELVELFYLLTHGKTQFDSIKDAAVAKTRQPLPALRPPLKGRRHGP